MKVNLDKYVKDGFLTTDEKLLLLIGLFAARREETEMIAIAEIAIEQDIPISRMAELISSAVISRGIPTWLSGIEAITLALSKGTEQKSEPNHPHATQFGSIEECMKYYQSEFEVLPTWVQYLIDYAPEILLTYSNIRNVALNDGRVSRLLKELLLYAINVCDDYPKGIDLHRTNALQLGADEDMLQEVKELCIIVVGLKAIL